MKNLRTSVLCVSILLMGLCASAQQNLPLNEPNLNKPKLFEGFPDSIILNLDNVISLFTTETNRPVTISATDGSDFRFEGSLISSVNKYENTIKSVIIRSTNFPGARLTLSRIIDERGVVSYTGRILSMQHGDLYELKRSDEKFMLVKRKFYDVVNE